MLVNRSLAVGVGLTVGALTGVGLYAGASASPTPARQASPAGQQTPDLRVTTPAPTVSYAPCSVPAKLEHGICTTRTEVTEVARTTPTGVSPVEIRQPVRAPNPSSTSRGFVTQSQRGAASPRESSHLEEEHEGEVHDDEGGVEPRGD